MACISEVNKERREMLARRTKSNWCGGWQIVLGLFWSASELSSSGPDAAPGHGTNVFSPASTPAKSIADLSVFVLVITGVIFVVVFALLIYSVVRFRARAMDAGREPAQVYGSTQIELAWTIIP